MEKNSTVHPGSGILFSRKKESALAIHNIEELHRHDEGQNPDKNHMFCDSMDVEFWKRQIVNLSMGMSQAISWGNERETAEGAGRPF